MQKVRWEVAQNAEIEHWRINAQAARFCFPKFWEGEILWAWGKPIDLKNKVVLEIGSGPFGIIYFLTNCSLKIGLDPLILTYKREIWNSSFLNKSNTLVLQSVGEAVPVINNSVDTIILYNTLDHVWNPTKTLLESYRILKKDGEIYFSVNLIETLPLPFLFLNSLIRRLLSIFDRTHPHHFTENEVHELFHSCGFVIYKSNSKKWKEQLDAKEKINPKNFKFLFGKILMRRLHLIARKSRKT